MKSKIIFLILVMNIIPNFIYCMDIESGSLEEEQSNIIAKIELSQGQCEVILRYIETEKSKLPSGKESRIVPHLQKLEESVHGQLKSLASLLGSLPSHGTNLPHSDLLKISLWDVSQIKYDVARLLQGEMSEDPIEKAAFNILHQYKSVLPRKINPLYVTSLCMITPAVLSLAAILSADDKAMKKEIVVGFCKVGLVGGFSGFLSCYAAKFWNPFRVKLDNGLQGDSETRICANVKSLEEMSYSIASYNEFLHGRQRSEFGIANSQLAADRATEARDLNLATNVLMGNLSQRVVTEAEVARERDRANAQRLEALERGQAHVQKSVDSLNALLKDLGSKVQMSRDDLVGYLNEEGKSRDRFESHLMTELDQMKWMQVKTFLNTEQQVYLTIVGLQHQGVNQKLIEAAPSSSFEMQQNVSVSSVPARRILSPVIYEDTKNRSQLNGYIKDWNRRNFNLKKEPRSRDFFSESTQLAIPEPSKSIEAKIQKINPVIAKAAATKIQALGRGFNYRRTQKVSTLEEID